MPRHSLVLAAQSNDPATSRTIEAIVAAYWRPLYKYVRTKWNIAPEDAADFTQEFFTRLLEKEFLDSYESSTGRLRTFLRTCADRLFMNQARDSKRLKRGVGSAHLSLDFMEAEQELATELRPGSRRTASIRSGSAVFLSSVWRAFRLAASLGAN
jgi:DNA-directed RNA polymerase specialized sigma24 family protein